MKRVLLFLALAAAGLCALLLATGGFRGRESGHRPEVTEEARDPAKPGGRGALDLDGLDPDGRTRLPSARIEGTGAVDHTIEAARTWQDRLTGERIEFPHYVVGVLHADGTEPVRDPATGEQGESLRGVRLRLYREAPTLTRAEAHALRDDPDTYRGLLRHEITGTEGRADFLTQRLDPSARIRPRSVKTLVTLSGEVLLHDLAEEADISTSEVRVDVDAGTAEGGAPLTAVGPGWRLTGRGFRLDRDSNRLEILEDATLDVDRPPRGAALAASPTGSAEEFRPTRMRSRGGAVVTRRAVGSNGAEVEILLEDDVRVEQEGGRRLGADGVAVILDRKAARANAPGTAPASPREAFSLTRMLARGHVRLRNDTSSAGSPSTVLDLETERMRVEFVGPRPLTVLEGVSRLTWHGEARVLGGPAGGGGPMEASCRERLEYGGETSGDGAVLVLIGDALVASYAADGDPTPQRIHADRLTLHLVPRPVTATVAPAPAPPKRARAASDLVATSFEAEGDVSLDGPRIEGRADRIVSKRLDRPDFEVVAEGTAPWFRLRAGVGGSPRGPRGAAGPDAALPGAPTAGSATPAEAPWRLRRVRATGEVRAHLPASRGETSDVAIEADTFVYDVLADGTITAGPSSPASLRLGDEALVRAPTIGFRFGAGALALWTDGDTFGRFRPPAQGARRGTSSDGRGAKAGSRGGDVVTLRAGTRIRLEGAREERDGLRVTLDDRAEVESVASAAEGDAASEPTAVDTAQRLSARSVEVRLERLATPTRDVSPAVGGATDAAAAATSPTPRAPAPAGEGPGTRVGEDEEWTLHTGRLEIETDPASRGLRTFAATRGVDAQVGASRFRGDALHYDGADGTARLDAAAGALADVRLGAKSAATEGTGGATGPAGDVEHRLASPRVDLRFVNGAVTEATFFGPVSGRLHGAQGGGHETIDLRADGELRVTANGADVVGPAQVRRTVDAGTGASANSKGQRPPPFTLTSPHLRIDAPGMLGGGSVRMERLVAEGPGTRLESGEDDAKQGRAVGTRLVYDAVRGRMVLTGAPKVEVDWPGAFGTMAWFAYDVTTGLPDLAELDFTFEVEGR